MNPFLPACLPDCLPDCLTSLVLDRTLAGEHAERQALVAIPVRGGVAAGRRGGGGRGVRGAAGALVPALPAVAAHHRGR